MLKTYDEKLAAAQQAVGALLEQRTEVGNDLGMQQLFRDLAHPDEDIELSAELFSQLNDIDPSGQQR